MFSSEEDEEGVKSLNGCKYGANIEMLRNVGTFISPREGVMRLLQSTICVGNIFLRIII